MSKKLDALIDAAETVIGLWGEAKIIAEETYPESEFALIALSEALTELQAAIALAEGADNDI